MHRRAAALFAVALLSFTFTAHIALASTDTTDVSPFLAVQAFIAGMVNGAEAMIASIEMEMSGIATSVGASLTGTDSIARVQSYTAAVATPIASDDASARQSAPATDPNPIPSLPPVPSSPPPTVNNGQTTSVSPINVFALQSAISALTEGVQGLTALYEAQTPSSKIESQIAALQSALSSQTSGQSYNASAYVPLGDGAPNTIAAANNISNLSGVTITNANLTASEIPTLDYLSLSGGTITGAITDSSTAPSSFVGALGIGTTSPSDLFALNGAAYLADISAPPSTTNRLYANSGNLYWAGNLLGGATTGNWTSDGTNVWRTGGAVGIGTSSPFAALSVIGNGYFAGGLTTASLNTVNASTTNLSVSGTSILGNATSTSLFSTTASSTNLFAQSAHVGSLTLTTPLSSANGGTGSTGFGQGWIYSDGISGALAASTSPTVNYITATSTTVTSTFAAGLTIGAGSATNLTITGGASAVTLQANSGGSGAININSKNGQSIVFNNQVNAPFFRVPGNTTTLSGSTAPTFLGNFFQNLAGTSTASGNAWGSDVSIGNSSDNASINNGAWNELYIAGNFGGNNFTGGRFGMLVQLNLNSTSTLNASGNGLVGYGSKVTATVNAGGSSSGFGTTNFGMGSLFGSNPWCDLETGATNYTQCIGEEIDGAIETGASAANFDLQQLVLTSDHAVHGTNRDAMQVFAAQIGASAGVRNVIQIGDYQSQWPVDPNGYLLQVQSGGNYSSVPTVAAAGFDLNQLQATGTGTEGGGFYWRSPGVQLLNSALQVGYGLISTTSIGVQIDTPYYEMNATAGSISVATGGSNFTSGDLVCDVYGDCVKVNASGGAVTGVSVVVTRGWQTAPPSNPIAFTARTRSGSAIGSGLTLNLGAWTSVHTLALNPTSGGNVAIGTSTPFSRLEVFGSDAASSTSAFAVVNTSSTTLFAVFDGGNAQLSGTLTQSSDQRLKTNIQDLDGSSSLAKINALNPVTFNWIDQNQDGRPQLGFIAQQVQGIFPSLVSTTSATALTPGGTLGVNYIDLISPIVAAIQELDKEITSLASTVSGFAQSITSAVGNFGQINTQQVNTSELCVQGTCVTGSQLAALLAAPNQSESAPASQSSPSDATDTLDSTSSPQAAIIQINGDNPAVIQVGASYADLGATITSPQADLNLGIETYLNGVLESPMELDTSSAATDTIAYVVTDRHGLTSTSTRTVIVEPAATPPTLPPVASSTATSSSATSTSQ